MKDLWDFRCWIQSSAAEKKPEAFDGQSSKVQSSFEGGEANASSKLDSALSRGVVLNAVSTSVGTLAI